MYAAIAVLVLAGAIAAAAASAASSSSAPSSSSLLVLAAAGSGGGMSVATWDFAANASSAPICVLPSGLLPGAYAAANALLPSGDAWALSLIYEDNEGQGVLAVVPLGGAAPRKAVLHNASHCLLLWPDVAAANRRSLLCLSVVAWHKASSAIQVRRLDVDTGADELVKQPLDDYDSGGAACAAPDGAVAYALVVKANGEPGQLLAAVSSATGALVSLIALAPGVSLSLLQWLSSGILMGLGSAGQSGLRVGTLSVADGTFTPLPNVSKALDPFSGSSVGALLPSAGAGVLYFNGMLPGTSRGPPPQPVPNLVGLTAEGNVVYIATEAEPLFMVASSMPALQSPPPPPPPPPHEPSLPPPTTPVAPAQGRPTPAEIWSTFFSFNSSDSSCGTDVVGARLFAARFAPAAADAAWRHSVVDITAALSPLLPIHSKTLTFSGGATMAADAVGRRAWALLGTTDWTPHTWVVQLAFPAKNFNQTNLMGVCEIVNSSMAAQTYVMQGLTYSSSIVPGGGAYWLNSDSDHFYDATVSVVHVPPFDPGATAVPPCTLTNVSNITSAGAFSPFIIPLPVRGTDRRGNPLLLEFARNVANTSQIVVQAWSALSGKLVYNQTWACGAPSYLYSCPPTNGGIPDGLNGAFLTRGTLLLGGGPWSSQFFFQGTIPALAIPEEEEEGEEMVGGMGWGQASGEAPVLTFVNASSSQATWLTGFGTSLFTAGAAPNGWPLTAIFVPGGSGTCAKPGYSSQMISTSISRDGWAVNSTPFGSGDGVSPGCPWRQAEAGPWWATAACAGASYAFPDNLLPAV
jgi:hypothetical protein